MLDDGDLQSYVEAFGVDCAKGATAFKGILDIETMPEFEGQLVASEYVLTYVSSAVTLSDSDAVTVGGISYAIREVRSVMDGKFSKAYLEKA